MKQKELIRHDFISTKNFRNVIRDTLLCHPDGSLELITGITPCQLRTVFRTFNSIQWFIRELNHYELEQKTGERILYLGKYSADSLAANLYESADRFLQEREL